MSDIAIRVGELSKQYRIGALKNRHDTFRDDLMHSIKSAFRRNGDARRKDDTFWALKNLSFDIKQGDVVGIVGDVVPRDRDDPPVDSGKFGEPLELALALAGAAMELVSEAFDRDAPLRKRAVEPVGGIATPHGVLAHRAEPLRAQSLARSSLRGETSWVAGCRGLRGPRAVGRYPRGPCRRAHPGSGRWTSGW